VNFSTLVRFSKLVSDSATSDGIFALLGQTVVEKCGASHALVFGTSAQGDFTVLSSYGALDAAAMSGLQLEGVCSLGELRSAVMEKCGPGFGYRAFPLISEARLFGVLVVLYPESKAMTDEAWNFIEGLTELTAISLNKTYQHEKLQKAFDELRISQDTLIRTEKLRALGEMSAGIAHDLKNLLNPLLLYSDLIRDVAGDRNEVLEISQRVERILTRGLETVERLRDFSRQTPEETEAVPTDLNSIVNEAIAIIQPRLGATVLVRQFGTPAVVSIRPGDCVTAVVNLFVNALDALVGKGTVIVRTGASDGGGWIEVQDNGPGMSEEIKSRILEPFFTTKGDLGTGLGVPIVYAFTQRHGGRLEIESEPGHGAKFKMWFPSMTNG
jgi:signal transduction histidine kinase